MTEQEKRMVIALNCCTFVPGTGTKRFARDMASITENKPEHELTPKQREYLRTAVIRFRRQIDPQVVEMAQAMGELA